MKVFFQPRYPTSVKVNVNGGDIDSVSGSAVDNVLKVYSQANSDEMTAAQWYYDAHNHAKELATISGLSIHQTAGVIAIISPKQKWALNVDMAYRGVYAWMQGERIQLSPSNSDFTQKAYDLMNGIEHANYGQKVTTFWRTIEDPKGCQAVTVDSVATSIALGPLAYFPGTYSLGAGANGKPSAPYAKMQEVYVEASKVAGTTPTELQAISWTTCRRLKQEHKALTGKRLHSYFNDFCEGQATNVVASDFINYLETKGIVL